MIIDMHTHLSLDQDDAAVDRFIYTARRYGIEKMCVLGDVLRFGDRPTEAQIRQINDHTIRAIRRHPSTLFGFCFLNPAHDRAFSIEEIERCVVEEGFRGVKLEISVNARDSRLNPIMEKAGDLGVPVLHHAWYKAVDKYPHESDPSDIAHLAARFPNVRIIMAHLTAAGPRGVLDIQPHPNVWGDTSGSQPFAGMVEYAVEKLGAHRVVFGADVPGRDFSAQLGRILGAKIGPRDRRRILELNAKELLGI